MVKILRYQSDTGAQYGVLEGDATVRQLVGSPFGDYDVGQAVGSCGFVEAAGAGGCRRR